MFASLVLLGIAQDCSLGHYLTSSRAETSKTKKQKMNMAQIRAKQPQIGTKMRFSRIFFLTYFIKRGKILLN